VTSSTNIEYSPEGREEYNAFDGSGQWTSLSSAYNSDGTPRTSHSFEGILGQWLKLELPKKIKLSHLKFSTMNASVNYIGPPRKGIIWVSNDDASWSQIYTFDVGELDSDQNVQLNAQTDTYYKYIVLHVTEIGDDGALGRYVRIKDLQYYGTEEGDESVDMVHRSIPNKPSQQQLAVYYEARDPNSYSFADSTKVYDLSGNRTVTGTLSWCWLRCRGQRVHVQWSIHE
jgi:hypothetical protein